MINLDFPLHDEYIIAALAPLSFDAIAEFRIVMASIARTSFGNLPKPGAVLCALSEVGWHDSYSVVKALRKCTDDDLSRLESMISRQVKVATEARIKRVWRTVRDLIRGVIAERIGDVP